MPRQYSMSSNVSMAASSTLPMQTLLGTSAVRPVIYDLQYGSDATPADQAFKVSIQRCTSAGTAGSNPTPTALRSDDPAAASVWGLATFSGGPTLTANSFPYQTEFNQRATVRWVAAPGSELVGPATASNGFAFMLLTATATVNLVWCVLFAE